MFSDWLILEYKSRKTFDIIVSTKSVFFKISLWWVLQPKAPPSNSRCACLAYIVLVCNGIQDKDEGGQFLQNIGICQTTCHIPEDFCYLQLWEPHSYNRFGTFCADSDNKLPSRILELKWEEVTWWRKITHWGASKFIFFSKFVSIN